jgi:hypothetical protein
MKRYKVIYSPMPLPTWKMPSIITTNSKKD